MGDSSYTMIQVGEGTAGGMMQKQSPRRQANGSRTFKWMTSKTRRSRPRKLGGKVVVGVTEVPDMGSFSIIADPEGAVFGLWEPKSK